MKKNLLFCLSVFFFSTTTQAQQTVGLFYADTLAQEGYTLLPPFNSNSTYLIDICGNKVNEWVSAYTPGASAYFTESGLMARTGLISSNTFGGGGLGGIIEFFDWEGNVVRSINLSDNQYAQHHDFEVLPNGNVLVIAWELRSAQDALDMGRLPINVDSTGIWSEAILEYQLFPNDSEAVVWEWHAWDHLVQDVNPFLANYDTISQRPERININYCSACGFGKDWLHFNSIAYNPELDQIMVCTPIFAELWIIDHSTTTMESSTTSGGMYGKGGDLLYRFGNPQAYGRGLMIDQKLRFPHHAHWVAAGLPNEGKVIVFNNRGSSMGLSRVEIFTPPTTSPGFYLLPGLEPYGPSNMDWQYEDSIFSSQTLSGALVQPNGNVFISEGTTGRMFEVDSDKNIHWIYVNPVHVFPITQGDTLTARPFFRAEKYTPDYAGFVGLDLTPSTPIEINPIEYDCAFDQVTDTTDSIDFIVELSGVQSLTAQNPFGNELKIFNRNDLQLNITLINQLGQSILTTSGAGNAISIPAEIVPSGSYILRCQMIETGETRFIKLLKTNE